uniref:Methyltransferase like 25B n=1 Tax=Mus musculus TaxID=10090 RepID=E9Q693_MOUSE
MARSTGWTEPTTAGHPAAGDAEGRGGNEVQVCVATHPAGPEVHSLCPRLYPDTWLSHPIRVPGEPQPELPTNSSFSETCQAQEAA